MTGFLQLFTQCHLLALIGNSDISVTLSLYREFLDLPQKLHSVVRFVLHNAPLKGVLRLPQKLHFVVKFVGLCSQGGGHGKSVPNRYARDPLATFRHRFTPLEIRLLKGITKSSQYFQISKIIKIRQTIWFQCIFSLHLPYLEQPISWGSSCTGSWSSSESSGALIKRNECLPVVRGVQPTATKISSIVVPISSTIPSFTYWQCS